MLFKNVVLDPFQSEALKAIDSGFSLLVSAPTGSGKTLIAEYAIEKCLQSGKRLIYTAPIKALSNQKFRDFAVEYGSKVGIKTGDVSINPDAQIVLMTTEIFRNTIFENPDALSNVEFVVLDEIHYLDDIERGTVWEECVIFAPEHIRLICLSATVQNLFEFTQWISRVRKASPLYVIIERERSVPLETWFHIPGIGTVSLRNLIDREKAGRFPHRDRRFEKRDQKFRRDQRTAWLNRFVGELQKHDRLPAIVFAFVRRECESMAASINRQLLTDAEKTELLAKFNSLCETFNVQPDERERLGKMLARGVCYHHAGLLPATKEVIERLFSTGLVKLLFATETFAVGVNMPARSVIFSEITKFDGTRRNLLRCREFQQMSGRAGRRGIDKKGYVYLVADWPAIPSSHLAQIVRGRPEPIVSQFSLSYSTILTLYEHLKEKLFTAVEASFANFGIDSTSFEIKKQQIAARLKVLREANYLFEDNLTQRGQIAKRIYGYEMLVTEFYAQHLFDEINEDEINALAVAICYEARHTQRQPTSWSKRWNRVIKQATQVAQTIVKIEESCGVTETTRLPDFGLSYAAYLWSKGYDFQSVTDVSGIDGGDLVRNFRLAIQILRNLKAAIPWDSALLPKLDDCVRRMKRDEVDAEWQVVAGLPAGLADTFESLVENSSSEPQQRLENGK